VDLILPGGEHQRRSEKQMRIISFACHCEAAVAVHESIRLSGNDNESSALVFDECGRGTHWICSSNLGQSQ
jgi:hypothetical protein